MKTKQLILCWSLVTGGFIALFWAVNYPACYVPIITSIKISKSWIIALPFGISRWWDILIGPIWSTIAVLVFASEKSEEEIGEKLTNSLFFGLVVCACINMAFILDTNLVISLISGLIISLGVSLVLGPIFGLGISLGIGMYSGLTISLGVGLIFGLIYSLYSGLIFGLYLLTVWVSDLWIEITD